MTNITSEQRVEFLDDHPSWAVTNGKLQRDFVFEDFVEATGFVMQVALLAEKAFHHPDIDIRWNTVTITLSTHDAGALTEKDLTLAKRLDRINR